MDFEAWGHEFFAKQLAFEQYAGLMAELEMIDTDEECGHQTAKQKSRRAEIERLVLTHESYFEDGPRVTITLGKKN